MGGQELRGAAIIAQKPQQRPSPENRDAQVSLFTFASYSLAIVDARTHVVQRKRQLLHQGVRFVLTGAINTGFSYCIYAACIFAGAGYALASAASLVGGILFSYKTTSHLVFRQPNGGSLQRYIVCYAVVYGFNVLLLKLLDSFGIDPYVCGLIAAVPTAVLSFVLLKLLVFRTQRGG
jgi:putative flippase GtrA